MMRLISLYLGLSLVAHLLPAQSAYYYATNGRVELSPNTERIFVQPSEGTSQQALVESLKGLATVVQFDRDRMYQALNVLDARGEDRDWYWAEIQLLAPQSVLSYGQTLRSLAQKTGVDLVAPYYGTGDAAVSLTPYLVVQLKDEDDRATLEAQATADRAVIVGRDPFMPDWYTVRVSTETGRNALQLANRWHESGQFRLVSPSLMATIEPNCASDPLFGNQWNLKNTSQQCSNSNGIDVNACGAYNQGSSSVEVAVIDEGVQLNHPDLQANLSGSSYDTETSSSPSRLWGSHGTRCAGIVGARKNNGRGGSSVAPFTRMISVSNRFGGNPGLVQELANGINWAWQNGAEVLSNSWGAAGSASFSQINAAISNALNNGRGGRGSVVVFSAGNSNVNGVGSPADDNDDIIAVGAMSPNGQRKSPSTCDGETWWGSNYGSDLDIMAPGVKIPTTTNGSGYVNNFNGTSAACPHVAGVAALVINQNPCLTQDQVRDIIELSARKVGGYTYANTSGRPNGTWDREMGYGLVDAREATKRALPFINGPDLINCNGTYTTQAIPGSTSYTWTWTGSTFIRLQPSGTTARLVNTTSLAGGGTLCVRANNAFGACTQRCRTLGSPPCGWFFDGDAEAWLDVEDVSNQHKGVEPAAEVEVFPNPTNEVLNLRLEVANAFIEVVAADGRVVLATASNDYRETLDLSAQPAGVYLLRVIQPNRAIYTEKVVVF
ncbi:MAG: S8 family serine peptidase [Bacteroidota bacterium]